MPLSLSLSLFTFFYICSSILTARHRTHSSAPQRRLATLECHCRSLLRVCDGCRRDPADGGMVRRGGEGLWSRHRLTLTLTAPQALTSESRACFQCRDTAGEHPPDKSLLMSFLKCELCEVCIFDVRKNISIFHCEDQVRCFWMPFSLTAKAFSAKIATS